ncbi:MAG TPA: Flp pilus assembly protein CpaB [Anaerolineae bacterium]|nr:Flp pilus assembly protein CpaB [Anaerolineae bacterium]
MRPRTFIAIVLVLVVVAAAIVGFLFFRNLNNTPPVETITEDGIVITVAPGAVAGQPATLPTATAEYELVPVVVASIDLDVGTKLTADYLDVERRPSNNVAIRANYTFTDTSKLIGRIVGTNVSEGQEILESMLAFSSNDITAMGSDLAIQLEEGRVAVAFPIDEDNGVAYSMRPGDLVDIIMTLELRDLDPVFQSGLPNKIAQVNQNALLEGRSFLFPETPGGRLEVIPGLDLIGLVVPQEGSEPLPRRVSQLTVQQVEVVWMGTWIDPRKQEEEIEEDINAIAVTAQAIRNSDNPDQPVPTLEPTKQRPEDAPDLVILSLSSQDALVLKWAYEVGIQVDLVLRAQGDDQFFNGIVSVSLPQAVQQGGLTIPNPGPIGLFTRFEDVVLPTRLASPPLNVNP